MEENKWDSKDKLIFWLFVGIFALMALGNYSFSRYVDYSDCGRSARGGIVC